MRAAIRLGIAFRKLVLASLPLAGLAGCPFDNGCQSTAANCPQGQPAAADGGPPSGFAALCTSCGGTIDCYASSIDGGVGGCECLVAICGGTGRRPAGLRRASAASCADEVGRYFASATHLEAASVHAFRRLREDLSEHGAPSGLLAAAGRAANDEVRHTRINARLARAHGAQPASVSLAKRSRRSLEEIALENAIEGCTRESYGALLATWQSRAAGDPAVRIAMSSIARDETRHAELAWAVARWAEPRLTRPARGRVESARRDALSELHRAARVMPSETLVREVGLPRAAAARALLAGLAATLA